jgi:hypothetical protein
MVSKFPGAEEARRKQQLELSKKRLANIERQIAGQGGKRDPKQQVKLSNAQSALRNAKKQIT